VIDTIVFMCSILALSPLVVDCDTQWVVIEDTRILIFNTNKGIAVYNYTALPITTAYPDAPAKYDGYRWMASANLRHDNCWADEWMPVPTNCIPIIWHEIKHQICVCNWHEDKVMTWNALKIFK